MQASTLQWRNGHCGKTRGYLKYFLAVNDGIATIILNGPEAINVFSGDMRKKLLVYLGEVPARDDVSCVGITGTGKAFCAVVKLHHD